MTDFPQDGKSWNEVVIQSRSKLTHFPGYSPWGEIPAGPGTLDSERTRIKALRERRDGREYRLVIRTCVVIDYDLTDGTPLDQTTGG